MTQQEDFSSSMHAASLLLDQLIEILHEERNALTQGEASQTHAILERKTQVLAQIDQNAKERNQLLTSLGFSTDEQGTQDFFSTMPLNIADACKDTWQSLQAKLETCKSENLVNGKVIHRSRQQLNNLFSMLQGNQGNSQIYTDTGQAKAVNSQHPLAKA